MDEIVIPKFKFGEEMIDRAIILAGGFGTRLKDLTRDTPKPLLDIKGKPILEHLIVHLKKYGVRDIVISVGYLAQKIIDHFGNGEKWGVNLQYSIETEPLGTGGAVKMISDKWSTPFLLLWGDNLCNLNINQLRKVHQEQQTSLTMTLVERHDTENFGVAVTNGNDIIGFVEKPKREEAPSNLINAGVFILSPHLLFDLPQKFSIERDLFEKIVQRERVSYFVHHGLWLPTDTPEKLELARLKWK